MPRKAKSSTPKIQEQKLPTGLPYGEHQQLQAQQASPPPGPQQIQPAPDQGGDPMAAALASAQQMQPTNVGLGAPTQNPQEPLMAGTPSAPGPSPSLLGYQVNTLGNLLSSIANTPGASPDVQYLAGLASEGKL